MSFQYVLSALKTEAERWDAFAAEMKQVAATIANLELGVTAFFMVSPTVLGRLLSGDTAAEAAVQNSGYETFRKKMEELASGAVIEFGQMGDVLIKTANEYDEANEQSKLDLEKLYRA